jgi:hypothetical protein
MSFQRKGRFGPYRMVDAVRKLNERYNFFNQVVLFALPLIILLPFFLGGDIYLLSRSELGSDYTAKQLPNALFFQQVWRETKSLPTWQPRFMSGVPVLGNPSFLISYPPYWIVALLPAPLALNLLFALHLGLAGFGVFNVARIRFKLSSLAATCGGIAYMFSPKLLAHVSGGQLDIIIAVAWLPIALLGVDRVLLGFSFGWGWLAGLAFGFMFVGHAPTAFLAAIFLVAYILYLLVTTRSFSLDRKTLDETAKRLIRLSGMGSLGFFLASGAHIFPFVDLLSFLNRAQLSISDAAAYALPAELLPTLLAIPSTPFPEWIIYTGAGIAIFGLYGVIRATMWGKRFWLIVSLFSILFAMGTATPLFAWIFRTLPGFDLLRVPSRTWFFVSLMLAFACSVGVDRFLEKCGGSSIFSTLVFSMLILSTVLLNWLTDVWQWLALVTAAISVCVIFGLSQYREWEDNRNVVGILLLLILMIELSVLGWSFWRTGMAPERPPWFDDIERYAGYKLGRLYTQGRLSPYDIVSENLEVIEGLDPVQLSHYVAYIEEATNCRREAYSISVPSFASSPRAESTCSEYQVDSDLLGLLNVSYALTTEPQRDPGWRLEVRVGDDYLYRNEHARPDAFLVYQTEPVTDEYEARLRLETISNEDPMLVIGGKKLDLLEGGSGSVHITRSDPGRVEAEVTSDAPAFLALSTSYMPGWKAIDENGHEREVYQAQLTILGSYVPAGYSRLTFVYSPDSHALGKNISMAAALLSIMFFIALKRGQLGTQKRNKGKHNSNGYSVS